MKISVRKVAPDVFSLTFDDTTVALEGDQIKQLLLQITRVLSPGTGKGKSREEVYHTFLRRLRNANDVGVQALIRAVDPDDVLVLLKLAEDDERLQAKFYGNMSENSRKMFAEDLAFKFDEGMPDSRRDPAMKRLMNEAARLHDEGLLVYQNVTERRPVRNAAQD